MIRSLYLALQYFYVTWVECIIKNMKQVRFVNCVGIFAKNLTEDLCIVVSFFNLRISP